MYQELGEIQQSLYRNPGNVYCYKPHCSGLLCAVKAQLYGDVFTCIFFKGSYLFLTPQFLLHFQ